MALDGADVCTNSPAITTNRLLRRKFSDMPWLGNGRLDSEQTGVLANWEVRDPPAPRSISATRQSGSTLRWCLSGRQLGDRRSEAGRSPFKFPLSDTVGDAKIPFHAKPSTGHHEDPVTL